MKGLLIVIGVVLALYIADQQFAHGRYTDAIQRMAAQMRHSFGM
ncbi:hypothetical protein [Bradyrhizobium sp. USDA 3364]